MNDPAAREVRSLLCRTGEIICAFPLPAVVETMRPLPVQAVGGMPEFVRGVSIIRGAAVPVVDTGKLLVLPDAGHAGRFVTLRTGRRMVAMALDEVIGVRGLASVSIQDLPPLLRRVRPRVVTLIGMLDERLLVVLQESRIVPDWCWKSLAGDGDTLCRLG